MNITNFLFKSFEFVASPHQIVEYVPDLSLIKEFVEIVSIFYFAAQYEFKFIKHDLKLTVKCTLTKPELPQSPAFSKECDDGTRKSSRPSSSSIFLS